MKNKKAETGMAKTLIILILTLAAIIVIWVIIQKIREGILT